MQVVGKRVVDRIDGRVRKQRVIGRVNRGMPVSSAKALALAASRLATAATVTLREGRTPSQNVRAILAAPNIPMLKGRESEVVMVRAPASFSTARCGPFGQDFSTPIQWLVASIGHAYGNDQKPRFDADFQSR